MNAAMTMETCPDSETLAAFSDDVLDAKARLEVMEHVADCGQCQYDLVELDEAKRELRLEPDNVRRGPFGRRWIAPLAAAAIVVVLFGIVALRKPTSGMAELVKAASAEPERPSYGRLSGDFPYKIKRVMRNAENTNGLATAEVYGAAAEIAKRAEKNPTPENLHAEGVANLFLNDKDRAEELLERAANRSPQSAEILTDLAVAYLARGDYERALTAATRASAIHQTPATVWNRAYALQLLNRSDQAVAEWNKYLQLDPSSPWAEEVKTKHLPYLLPEP